MEFLRHMTALANIGNVYSTNISMPGNFSIIVTHLVYVQRIGIIALETIQCFMEFLRHMTALANIGNV